MPGLTIKLQKIKKFLKQLKLNKSGERQDIDDNKLTIACKDKAIRIFVIQKEGKKILKVKEFLAGLQNKKR